MKSEADDNVEDPAAAGAEEGEAEIVEGELQEEEEKKEEVAPPKKRKKFLHHPFTE